jgi:hypothetical protein
MPKGIFDIVGIHFAMDDELIDSLLVFARVIKGNSSLPQIGLDARIQLNALIKVHEGFVHFAASKQKGTANQMHLRVVRYLLHRPVQLR